MIAVDTNILVRYVVRDEPSVVVENADQIAVALQYYEAGMDFADALHLVSSLKLEGFATFDKRMANKATLLNISHKVILISVSPIRTNNEGTA